MLSSEGPLGRFLSVCVYPAGLESQTQLETCTETKRERMLISFDSKCFPTRELPWKENESGREEKQDRTFRTVPFTRK